MRYDKYSTKDEKLSPNDRVYGCRKKDFPVKRPPRGTTVWKEVMVPAGASWRAKTRILFFIDTNTTTVNSENCIKLLNGGLLRDCKRLYSTMTLSFK